MLWYCSKRFSWSAKIVQDSWLLGSALIALNAVTGNNLSCMLYNYVLQNLYTHAGKKVSNLILTPAKAGFEQLANVKEVVGFCWYSDGSCSLCSFDSFSNCFVFETVSLFHLHVWRSREEVRPGWYSSAVRSSLQHLWVLAAKLLVKGYLGCSTFVEGVASRPKRYG